MLLSLAHVICEAGRQEDSVLWKSKHFRHLKKLLQLSLNLTKKCIQKMQTECQTVLTLAVWSESSTLFAEIGNQVVLTVIGLQTFYFVSVIQF